jgi:Acetyltransferase (GNAT) domain
MSGSSIRRSSIQRVLLRRSDGVTYPHGDLCDTYRARTMTSMISAEEVMEAVSWVWVPEDAIQFETEEFRLIRYPDRCCDPTFPPAQLIWSKGIRSARELIGEVAAHIRTWGLSEVSWRVSPVTPAEIERTLVAEGATLSEVYRVMAYDLDSGLPELGYPDDLVVELVSDEPGLRSAMLVNAEGWGSPRLTDAEFAQQLERMALQLETRTGFRVLVSIGGEPVATGGCTLAGDVAHLLGSVTLPAWRRRGAYRAVLAERLRLASQSGARLALVKGRVETSAPILSRAGFVDHGQERRYRLHTS